MSFFLFFFPRGFSLFFDLDQTSKSSRGPPFGTKGEKKKKKRTPPPHPARPEERQHLLDRRRRALGLARGVHLESAEFRRRHQLERGLERQPHLGLFGDPGFQPLDLVEVEDQGAEDGVRVGEGLRELGGPGPQNVGVAKDRDLEPRATAAGVCRGELVEPRVEGLEAGDEDEGARPVGERANVARRGSGSRRGRSGGGGGGILAPSRRGALPRERALERALERRPLPFEPGACRLERRRFGLERLPGEGGSGRGRTLPLPGSLFGLGGEQGAGRGRVGAAEREEVRLGELRGGRELDFLSGLLVDSLVREAAESCGVGGVELRLEVGGLREESEGRERLSERARDVRVRSV